MPINCCSDCDAPLYVNGGRRIRVYTEDLDGDRTDPSTLTITLTDPSGNEDPYTYPANIQKAGTGNYYYDPAWDEAGEWEVKIESTGPVHDTVKFTVEVLP